MSPMESQMQVQKGLVWATLLLGAMVFGFFMASETMLLVLAVAGVSTHAPPVTWAELVRVQSGGRVVKLLEKKVGWAME